MRSLEPSSSRCDLVSNMEGVNKEKMPSFWLPSQIGSVKESVMEKPTNQVLCPMSGKPLRFKDLVQVKFTVADHKKDSSAFEKV